MQTIENFLDSLIVPKKWNNMSAKEIWNNITAGESFDEIGFDSEEEMNEWIKDNPYENL